MRRRAALAAVAVSLAAASALLVAAPASGHTVPSTTIQLDVHETDVSASLTLPAADLVTASGIEVGDGVDETTAEAITGYLEEHIRVTSDAGTWDVAVDDVATTETEQWGTGSFRAITATATLAPPGVTSPRSFTLEYDAIIHQVVTADIFVSLRSDWATGQLESARDLGTITLDTVTGTVAPLVVDLDDGSLWQGFVGMVTLGMSHIAEGTDHQLFLLTLLLPAPRSPSAVGGVAWHPPGRQCAASRPSPSRSRSATPQRSRSAPSVFPCRSSRSRRSSPSAS